MNLIKNIKIDKKKIKEFSIVLTTLFLISSILYIKFLTGNYIFATGDFLAPKMISESIRSLTEIYGEFPYWLPSNFGGMPTIHSLQNISDYYIPNYIINILKLLGMPEIWTQLLHLIFAGLGIYVLLRYIKVDFIAALFGASMFLMTPFMNACIVVGHGSQIMTAAYIPWICWSLLKLWNNQNLQNLGLMGILVGFQLQRGHIQIAYYTWLMIGLFVLCKLIISIVKINKTTVVGTLATQSKFSLKFYYYLIGSLLGGFLMSVSFIWPSYIYSNYSARSADGGGIGKNLAAEWSFTFKEMITFIFPSYYGFGGTGYWGTIKPQMTHFPNYIGIFVLIFMCYGLYSIIKSKNHFYFIVMSLFFLLLSMGKNSFIFNLLYDYLPLSNKLRAPMMSLMMFQFLVITISALGLNCFLNKIKELNKNNKTLKIFQIIIGASALFFLFFKYFFIHSINIKAPNSIARAQDQLPEPFYLELLNSLQEITSNMIYDDTNRTILLLVLHPIQVMTY